MGSCSIQQVRQPGWVNLQSMGIAFPKQKRSSSRFSTFWSHPLRRLSARLAPPRLQALRPLAVPAPHAHHKVAAGC